MPTPLTENEVDTILLAGKVALLRQVPGRNWGEPSYDDVFRTNHKWYRVVMSLSNNLSSSKSRAKKTGKECNLTLRFLADLWIDQKGRCALTGVPLDVESGFVDDRNPYKTSIDRIDNSQGYVKGNVRLLTHWANNAKSTWDDRIFKEFVSNSTKIL